MTTITWVNDYAEQVAIISDLESRLNKVEKTHPVTIETDTPTPTQTELLAAWQAENNNLTPPTGAKIHIINGGKIVDILQHTSLDSSEEFDNDFLSLQQQREQCVRLLASAIVPDASYNAANPYYVTWDAADAVGFDHLEIVAYLGSTQATQWVDLEMQFSETLNLNRHNLQETNVYNNSGFVTTRQYNDLMMSLSNNMPGQTSITPSYAFLNLFIPYGLVGQADRGINLGGLGSVIGGNQETSPAYAADGLRFAHFGFEIENTAPITTVAFAPSAGFLQPQSTIEIYGVRAIPI